VPSPRAIVAPLGVLALAATLTLPWVEWSRAPPRPPPLPSPAEAQELVVAVRQGPVTFFPATDGTMIGVDADLLRRYASKAGLPVRFVSVDSPTAVLERLASGQAHVGAGGLLLPESGARPGAAPERRIATTTLLWTAALRNVELLLICNREGFRPSGWPDLEGATVAYAAGTGIGAEIAQIRAAHPRVVFRPLDLPSATGLIAQVSEGTIDYAIVGSLAATVARSIYLDFEVAFPLGFRRGVAWAVAPRFASLRDDLDRFLLGARRDGTLDRLLARYLPKDSQFQRLDAAALADDIRAELPRWRALFHDAQEKTGIEWRLLAAVAYQESKWDPDAISESGVRGLMQLTEETARRLGIRDRLDPADGVLGAARYLRDLKAKLPARIEEPDRTWLALAAFNIGLGHLEDARVLAQKQKLNPDHWSDVKRTLPLLALPEYYADAKHGYARGGMPVAFVDRVRGYYDVLLARQPPLPPRLRMATDEK
jgi:membrane-bound lytic murein transglycosylase F